MLFDLNPKERVSELFGRKSELAELSGAVERGEKLTVVYGIRRIGKTSLLKSFVSEKDFLSVFLDIRQIYYIHKRTVPAAAVYEQILREFTDLLGELGVGVEEQTSILSAYGENNITNLLADINKWCLTRKIKFLLVLDESQYLRFSRKVSYSGIIAWSLDNLKNIFFIMSGSEVGVLKEMLDFENPKAPLYGRFRNEILLKRFTAEESFEFLMLGFKEQGCKVNKVQIDQVNEKIGGLTGWLTYYGHYRTANNMDHKAALDKVFSEGSKIAVSEIENLIRRSRKRYLAIMNAISNDIGSWAEIKAYTMAKTGKIPDSGLDMLLSSLVKFSIIEKDSIGNYKIIDPILREHLRSGSRSMRS
jgi:uncharacterized protein